MLFGLVQPPPSPPPPPPPRQPLVQQQLYRTRNHPANTGAGHAKARPRSLSQFEQWRV